MIEDKKKNVRQTLFSSSATKQQAASLDACSENGDILACSEGEIFDSLMSKDHKIGYSCMPSWRRQWS